MDFHIKVMFRDFLLIKICLIKAGIAYPTDDTTYDEFLDMIAKLKDSGVTPIAIGSKNSGYSMWEFNEFFSRYGWEDNEKSYTGDKAKYSNDDMNACFEKIKGTCRCRSISRKYGND